MFTEKLNKLPNGVHVIEEPKAPENGVWEGYLDHDNVNHKSLQIWTGPRFTGVRVENYFLSTSAEMPWKSYLKVFSETDKVFVTYETPGDQVEAEDINLLQESLVDEIDRATTKENQIESKLDAEISRSKAEDIALDEKIELETIRATGAEEALSNALSSYQQSNDAEIQGLKDQDAHLSSTKADKTYVDTGLDKKYDKAQVYTKAEVIQKLEDLIGAAPQALDTLAEIADALNNDPNFAATITTELAKKVDKVSGKGLSSEDFTTVEKTKLAGIAAGATALALGTSSSTAYRGDRGLIAYNHSQATHAPSNAQANRSIATQAQAEAGTNNTTDMTPLRVAQAIAKLGSSVRIATGTYVGEGSAGSVNVGFAPKMAISFGVVNGAFDNNLTLRLPTGTVGVGEGGPHVRNNGYLTSTGFNKYTEQSFSNVLGKTYHYIAIG